MVVQLSFDFVESVNEVVVPASAVRVPIPARVRRSAFRPFVRESRREWSGPCKDCPYFDMCDDDCGRLGFSIDSKKEPKNFSAWLRR